MYVYVYTPLIPIAAPLGASSSGAQPCTGASEARNTKTKICEAEGNHGFSYEIWVFPRFFPTNPLIFSRSSTSFGPGMILTFREVETTQIRRTELAYLGKPWILGWS